MLAVPSQEVVDPVDRGDSNMQGVHISLWGQRNTRKERLGKPSCFVVDVENRQIRQECKPLSRSLPIASGAFGDNSLRNEQIEQVTVIVPPVHGQPLVACGDQISASPR